MITWIVAGAHAAACVNRPAPRRPERAPLEPRSGPYRLRFAVVQSLGFFSWSRHCLRRRLAGRFVRIPCSEDARVHLRVQRYAESGDSGAPATGVRVVLYRRAPDGSIACRPRPLGSSICSTPARRDGGGARRGYGARRQRAVGRLHHQSQRGGRTGRGDRAGFVTDGQQRLDFQ